MNEAVKRSNVLVVGSVPLASTEEVFDLCVAKLGEHLFGLPDGEIGPFRSAWVPGLTYLTYIKSPDLEPIVFIPENEFLNPTSHDPDFMARSLSTFRVKEGVTQAVFDLPFGSDALKSYELFCARRKEGLIPPGVRFQVDIPCTQNALVAFFPRPEDYQIVRRAYELGVQHSLAMIFERIPADDLVIQLDYCAELIYIVGTLDQYLPGDERASTEERLREFTSAEYVAPLAGQIPGETVLGYHICYGTWGGWPIARVDDMGPCVAVANALATNTPHRVDYFHLAPMPEPEDEFFAPLADLDVGDAKIFMGLELGDGVEALKARTRQVRRYLPEFGLAHYCGYGRDSRERLPKLLDDLGSAAGSLRSLV
jgi:hypothetical protein